MSRMLQNALRGNAAFSILTGLIFLFDSAPLAALTRLPALPIAVTGAGLLVFAAGLLVVSRNPSPRMGMAISLADLGWVLGTPLLILFTDMTTLGVELAVGIAGVVLVCATLQFVGALRLMRGSTPVVPVHG